MPTLSANHFSRHPVFEAIAHSARREILRVLLVRDEPVTEQQFAAHLAATDQRPTHDGSAADRHTVHTHLVHTHLPALADASLITWDRDAATVQTAPHPAFDDPRFRLLLEAKVDDLDAALSNLAIPLRRVLLTILKDTQTSITRTDLARELLRSDATDFGTNQDAIDDVLISLHHVHLPVLGDAGLIEYHRDTDRVTYTGHSALEEIFTIIYQPEKRLADSYDGFFTGLKAGIDELVKGPDTKAKWPHSWRDPYHG